MMRTNSLTAAFCLLPLAAQAQVRLGPEAQVRIQLRDSSSAGVETVKISGRYQSLMSDTLLVDVGNGIVSRIPRNRITRVSVLSGRKHPYLHDIAIGVAVGALVGMTIKRTNAYGATSTYYCPTGQNCRSRLDPERGMIGGAIVGTVVAAIGRDRWVRVDLNRP